MCKIPEKWYNIQADVTQLPPPRHPGTQESITPDDLAPLFPRELMVQEVCTERITTPEEVNTQLQGEHLVVYGYISSSKRGGLITHYEANP